MVSAPAGAPILLAGEAPEGVWFLVSGSLAAFRPSERSGHQLLGYIRPGEPVGEMAMIAKEPHSASVFAMRDSEVLKLSPTAFDNLVQAHPKVMQHIARLMLTRARMEPRSNPRAEPKVYALISTSPTIDLRLRARALQTALKRLGKSATIVGDEAEGMVSAWFDALEHDNDAVFLISPIADTPWFRTCLRQADRIWIMARADARPSTPLLPPEDASPARQFRLVDIILLHHGSERKAATTDEWRLSCDAARLFHWRGLEDEDSARLARVISGRSIGLVLSGGGARAYAHIGVVRALREAGQPFDIVGGTSMGALIAACVAMGWDDDEIEWRIRKAFVESNPLGDYVLPVVALTRGKRVEDRLREHFGETLIEDLSVPFFAVSTNLITSSIRVHRAGLLRQALRASISLPGILPPVVEGEHGLLVDGAVLKNFPVDVLKDLHRGPIIGVDVALREGIDASDFRNPPSFFGWVAAHGWQAPPPIASLLMRAATLAVDPWEGRSGADLLIAPEMPNMDLRDWKKFDDAVASGYEAAVAALQRPHGLFNAPRFQTQTPQSGAGLKRRNRPGNRAPARLASRLGRLLSCASSPPAPLALLLGSCSPSTDRTSTLVSCSRSSTADVNWTSESTPDKVVTRAEGPTCAQAVVTLVIRDAEGNPLWAFASTYYDMTIGGRTDRPQAVRPEEVDRFLASWVDVTVNRSGELPEWREGAASLSEAAEGMSYHTEFDRETYEGLRARNLPQLCFAAAVEASQCLVIDPLSNAPTLIVAYGA